MNSQRLDPDPNGHLPLWWMVWLAATIGTPIAVLFVATKGHAVTLQSKGALIPLVVGLIVHAFASHKLDQRSHNLFTPMLLLGGWAVMLGVFFLGCFEKTVGAL